MMNIQIFRNSAKEFPKRQEVPRFKYSRMRNCEFIWLGPIFILITNRHKTIHPIKYREWMKKCKAEF